jgi:chorismate lyase / 3-hydroxybenzoate synthase
VSVASPPRALAATEPLVFRRWLLGGGVAAPAALGGRLAGAHADALHAALLAPEGAVFDAWVGGSATASHRHGCVRYVTDGHWLHGVAEVDDREEGMHAAAQRAYRDLFEVLEAGPCPHVLRLWNYFADINRDVGGSERYRQFNAGRQQAFFEAHQSAFEGSPAACALGMRGGPLQVSFLAGQTPPLAIENPRQVSAYRYPAAYGPRSPTFSRAALAEIGGGRQVLFISGTASIVGHASMHIGDVRRQTEESLCNIAALRQVAADRAEVAFAAASLIYTVYLRDAADLPAVREAFEREVGAESSAAREAIYLQADICRADLLVEIEAHGFAPCRSGA